MIKKFEEFKNDNTLEEGLFNMFKTRKQFAHLQKVVVDEYEKIIEKDKNLKEGKYVLMAVKSFANKAYDKIITAEDALSFADWWKDFEKAHTYLLDKTVFGK